MDTANCRDEDRYFRTLVKMMQGQAYREMAAAQLFGYGLSLVPDLRLLEHFVWQIREETEHYKDVARMYLDFTGESIEPAVHARLATRPIPFVQSFYELAMAQFLYDRGGFWQLSEYTESSYLPYRHLVQKIIHEERGHQLFGERLVLELTQTGQYDPEKQQIFERWLKQGLLSFGRPNTEGAKYAVRVGLRKRDPAIAMQDYLNDIKATALACGLTVPPLATLGIDAPEAVDRVAGGAKSKRTELRDSIGFYDV
ncbi:MAG TPA: phenylacetate-CoA oxygenase subunit PaaI [Polyangium sp.]|nr:phenylacetate-CoA oxygenase subunit PaaI [Polyangium sp.]